MRPAEWVSIALLAFFLGVGLYGCITGKIPEVMVPRRGGRFRAIPSDDRVRHL